MLTKCLKKHFTAGRKMTHFSSGTRYLLASKWNQFLPEKRYKKERIRKKNDFRYSQLSRSYIPTIQDNKTNKSVNFHPNTRVTISTKHSQKFSVHFEVHPADISIFEYRPVYVYVLSIHSTAILDAKFDNRMQPRYQTQNWVRNIMHLLNSHETCI